MIKANKIKLTKKSIIIGIIFIVLVLASTSGYIGYACTNVNHWSELIYPGVKIENIDLSGKTKEEARKIIDRKYPNAIMKKKINIYSSNKKYTIYYSKLNIKYDTNKTLNEAFKYGKKDNLFKKNSLISNKEGKNFKVKIKYDSQPIKELISVIEKEVNKDSVNAKLDVQGENKINIVPEKKGIRLKRDKLQKEVLSKIDGSIDKDLNIKVETEFVKPKVTKDKLKPINALISSFSTNFGSISTSERANNIIISTRSINGTVVMPGETFSFNKVVGERTGQKGYQGAGVIIGNKVESGIGGGVCQTSSTLYNAILKANIKPTERTHHTLHSSYVPLGRDATVDYGNIDYKFKNTLPYPIYIEGYTSGGYVGFNIYSNAFLNKRRYEIISDVYQKLDGSTKIIKDPNLQEGKTEVVQNYVVGYKVKVYKNTYENKKLINKELISHDVYNPVNGIIKNGTKKIEKPDDKEKEEDKKIVEENKEKEEDKNKENEKKEKDNKKDDKVN